jgi:hypothetical protein
MINKGIGPKIFVKSTKPADYNWKVHSVEIFAAAPGC